MEENQLIFMVENRTMNNMQKTLKNGGISILGQFISFVLAFINRRLFVVFLDIEFLGYQSLFSNVFSLLSIVDMGMGSLIYFHLYRELANGNEKELGKLMQVYKLFYRLVAICVLCLGTVLSFFLEYFVKKPSLEWGYIRVIYFLQLGSIILGYFLAYRRTIYICDQKEYICIKVDVCVSIVIQISQIFILAVTKSYLLYLFVNLSTSIISNIIIYRLTNRDYPFLSRKENISFSYLKEKDFFKDIRDNLIHRICFSVYSGTDNIIISAFIGVYMVALYGNYYTVSSGLSRLLVKIYNPLQATIGKIVYSGREKNAIWKQFRMLDLLSYFIASIYSIGLLIFYQFTIEIWMGKDYLLPFSFVLVYTITIFLTLHSEMVYRYRAAFGEFDYDRNYMIISMLLNIIISVSLTKPLGVTGIQIGTLIAFLPIAYGRIKFVIKHYFEKSVLKFVMCHLVRLIVFSIECLLVYFISRDMTVTFAGFILRGLTWIIIAIFLNVLVFTQDQSFKLMLEYLKQTIKIAKEKIAKSNS